MVSINMINIHVYSSTFAVDMVEGISLKVQCTKSNSFIDLQTADTKCVTTQCKWCRLLVMFCLATCTYISLFQIISTPY